MKMNSVSNIFRLIGVFFLVLALIALFQRHNPQKLAFNDVTYASQEVSQQALVPTSLTIQSANIAVPVIPAVLDGNKWEATSKGVSYLSSSPIPGTSGNSIFYGHNWKNILGNLPKTKPGDLVEVRFNNGSLKNFEVQYTMVVSPSDTHILSETKDSRITIYTCTGFLDSKRFVVVAKPIE